MIRGIGLPLALLAAATVCGTIAPADEGLPRATLAVRTETPPVIDGVLDDEVWQNWSAIATVSDFTQFEQAEPAPLKTTAYVTYDDEAVYFALNLEEPHTDRLVADCPQGRPEVFHDDSLQIELQPSGTREGELFVLILNCRGVRATQMIDPQHAHSNRHDDNPAWQAATSVTAGAWTAEVKAPYSVLGVEPPKPGDRWRMNIHRFRRAGLDKTETSSWVCIFGQHWRHDRRGELGFA